MKIFLFKFVLSILLVIVIAGCFEEISDLNSIKGYTWTPELAIPISNSRFGLIDFLENDSISEYIQTDNEGLIILSYTEQFQSENASSYVEIPDETYNESVSFDAPLLIQLPIQGEITKTESFKADLENEEGDEIDSVLLKSGTIELSLQASFPASGKVVMEFTSALENGNPIQRIYEWTYTGQQPVLDIVDLISLEDIKFDLTDGGSGTNTFQFEIEVTLFYEGLPVLAENSLEASVKLLDAEFAAAYGQIATREISSDPETLQLDFFNNILGGSFYLDEPKFTLEFGNSFGVPVGITLNKLSATNGTDSEFLSGSITRTQQIVDAPDITEIGESVYSTIVIDNSNSNLPEIISILPTEISYQLEGIVNPSGITKRSFVLGESAIDIDLNVELPLIGKVSNLKVQQEFEFDGPEILDDFNYALIQINVENGLPLATDIQIFFLDALGQPLDVLIEDDQRIMDAASVDENGLVTEPSVKVIQIELDESKIELVRNTQNLLLEASFTTTDDGAVSVKFLDSYELEIKIGVQTKFNITLDL